MGLRLEQALSQNLEQRIAIQQVMLTAQVLSLPVGAVDVLLTAIASNPERAEKMIESSETNPRHSEHSLKSLYSGLVGSGESRGRKNIICRLPCCATLKKRFQRNMGFTRKRKNSGIGIGE